MTWTEYKHKLALKVPWIKDFVSSFDQRLQDALNEYKLAPTPYDPLLIEPLVTDVNEILDRCLVYRRDAQDFEVLAIRAASDYAKFIDLWETQRDLEIASLGLDRLREEQQRASETANKFEHLGDPLAPGFYTEAIGRFYSLQKAIETASRQEEGIRRRWEVTKR